MTSSSSSEKINITKAVPIILKSMMGTIFEWYQFAIYSYFSPVIGKVFFPTHDADHRLLITYGVFFVSYLARPIGGVLFSLVGDRYGRKHVLIWTLLLMAIPTTLIGFLPGYHVIGVYAPLGLILCRIIQGISMGGNYGGSLTFVFEHSTLNQRGFLSSLSVIGILVGLLLASLTLFIFDYLFTQEVIETFAFRIPFFLGIIVCGWTIVLKKTLPESPVFEENNASGNIETHPFKVLLAQHLKTLTRIVGIVALHDLSFYILFFYMMHYLTEFLGLSKQIVFGISSLSLVTMGASVLGSAWLSDKKGRIHVMMGASLFFMIATIPLFMLISPHMHWGLLLIVYLVLSVAVGAFLGPLPAFMGEIFPQSIRNTGITTTGNISGPIFGGSAQLVLLYLTKLTGVQMMPAFYIVLSAFIATWALRSFSKTFCDSTQ